MKIQAYKYLPSIFLYDEQLEDFFVSSAATKILSFREHVAKPTCALQNTKELQLTFLSHFFPHSSGLFSSEAGATLFPSFTTIPPRL